MSENDPRPPAADDHRPTVSEDARTSATDGSRTRLIARVVLVVLLLTLVVGGGLVARDLVEVRSALLTARENLIDVRGALADVDLVGAAEAIEAAEEQLARATDRTGTVRWAVAAQAPVAGRSIEVTRQVVQVADTAVEIADLAVSEGEEVLGTGIDIEVRDGRVDLEPLLETRALVERLPVDQLQTARDQLAAPRRGWIPDQLMYAREESLVLADEALATATLAQDLTTALPGFLGAEGKRDYFVGMQTSAELRGTGGLIGYFGVLTVDDGEITFGQSGAYEPEETASDDGGDPDEEGADGDADAPEGAEDDADDDGLDADDLPGTGQISVLDGPLDQPVETDAAFAARYGHLDAASDFSNLNVDPHLPTTARVALDLFAARTGDELDGVVLLDPVAVQTLLEVTGSELPVPDELAAVLGFDGAIPTDRFAQLTTADIYEVLGDGRSPERRLALRTLGDAAFAQVFSGGWSGAEMIRAVADASRGRHLQVFSEQPDEQAAFADIGVAGELPPEFGAQDTDAMVIVANNAVGGKQDVHLGHEFSVSIRLGEVFRLDSGRLAAGREATLGVTLDNPLPSSGMDPYIIGTCFDPDRDVACFEGPPGWNQTWFSAFLPAGSQLVEASHDEHSGEMVEYGAYHGFHVLDQFQVTPPESRGSFQADVTGWTMLEASEAGVVYEWSWWRQAKAIPDLLDVRVQPPPGWRIVDVEVVGGGDGEGFGVHGEGVELRAEQLDGDAHLTGTVTADTRLRVTLDAADE